MLALPRKPLFRYVEMKVASSPPIRTPPSKEAHCRRQEEILEKAILLFAAHGYADTDTQFLADQLQVGKGTLYRYFRSKEDLFLAAVDFGVRKLHEHVCAGWPGGGLHGPHSPGRSRLPGLLCRASRGRGIDDPGTGHLSATSGNRPTSNRRDEFAKQWQALYGQLIADGVFRDMPPERISNIISELLYGAMFTNFFSGRVPDFELQTEEIMDVVMEGVLSDGATAETPGRNIEREAIGCCRRGGIDCDSNSDLLDKLPIRAGPARLALLPILSGCSRAQAEVGDPPPPDIQVSTPVSRETTDKVEFIGHTESLRTITVRAMVTGYLDKVLFKEGDEVAENQPLFKIDPRIYQAEYDQAKANLVQAQAHLKRLEADLLRAKKLLPLKAMSQEDYDKAEGDRNEAAAAVEVAEATTTYAKQNLDYTTVTAQISGRVSRQMIDPGNMVKANDTALTTIVSMDPMYAYFDVDERTMLQIRRLVRGGKDQARPGRETPRSTWGWPTRKAIRTTARSISSTTRSMPPPARCGSAACFPIATTSSRRGFSCGSKCPSASRIRRCWCRSGPWGPTRGRSSFMSSTTRTR